MESISQAQPSTLVYLFAEHFAEPAKGITVQGALAPRTGAKVAAKHLVLKMYQAALMELLETGVVRLEAIEVKKLFGKEKALTLALANPPTQPLSALARAIGKSIQAAQKPEQLRVKEVVIRVIGGRESTYYPWLVALAPAMTEAAAGGYIQMPEKKPGLLKSMFNPTESLTRAAAMPGRVDALEPGLAALKNRLAAFEQSLGANAALLSKEIESGINDCTEHSSD